ncbi:MAG: hypothetical protein ACHQII_02975 [Bacteroidia bacterium]
MKITERPNWKQAFDKIKAVVNSDLDPLGVADTFDGEYDDLNFKIYSALLMSNNIDNLSAVIKKELTDYYGVTIPDTEILKVSEKLVALNIK